jgi:hypothetical protein
VRIDTVITSNNSVTANYGFSALARACQLNTIRRVSTTFPLFTNQFGIGIIQWNVAPIPNRALSASIPKQSRP